MSNHWAGHSAVTDPGKAGPAIDELPADLRALREAASRMVFHFRAGGDFAEHGVPGQRMAEINARYAGTLLGLLLERGKPSLARDREAPDRVVGCCRDATVLFLALARHKGIPARARVGFATYFIPDWLIDHVVAEVWDSQERRWRLIDPEMDSAWQPELNGRAVDWLDLTDDEFVTGPRAWQAARSGKSAPERHVVHPGLDMPVLRGWPYLAHNAIHDLAALDRTEMLLWDAWGVQLSPGPGPVLEYDAAVLDEVCALTADPGIAPDVVTELASRDGFRVPPVITRFDPNGGPPEQVDVSRIVSR
jgi:hypothetical protein